MVFVVVVLVFCFVLLIVCLGAFCFVLFYFAVGLFALFVWGFFFVCLFVLGIYVFCFYECFMLCVYVLGVLFLLVLVVDTRLSWKPHIEDMEKKCIKKLVCRPEEIVWNTLGYQLQDSKSCLHGSSPTISGIWGQHLGNSSQDAHQKTGHSSENWLEDNPWCHENHSHS